MSQMETKPIQKLAADTIRLLAADGVQKANSGHPGMPMGMADSAVVLWTKFMRFNPEKPDWPDRDRFVLSAGHGSMLLYSMLYLNGYDVKLEDLQSFRQWASRTPGHPEVGVLPGVETSTGPLGQGFSNGIGMAIAAKMTGVRYNTEQHKVLGNSRIFAIVSDGDLMEGVSSEAASLAGHLKLGNVIYLYDDNQITIEGSTSLAFSESVQKRFDAYGWHTQVVDGYDQEQIAGAVKKAIANDGQPSLIITKSHIGYGAPTKQDTAEAHGAPLGEEELKATKRHFGFPEDEKFYIPTKTREFFNKRIIQVKEEYKTWEAEFESWKNTNPGLFKIFTASMERALPADLEEQLVKALPADTNATRNLSSTILQKIAELVPSFIGGSADLDPSTKTFLKAFPAVQAGTFEGRNFHFGIREHAMGSIVNGLSLYGGFIPFGSTFLVFADYMRPPLRLASIMEIQAIHVFTHDSIFVGEDGPTHQPVEQLASLRAIPHLKAYRPADGLETALCWAMALRNRKNPSVLLLTRQKVAALQRPSDFKYEDVQKGGYVISHESYGNPEVAILASGSEVQFAIEAQKILQGKGYSIRVVSVPCKELFEQQDEAYKRKVLPASLKKLVVVEAGVPFGWEGYFNLPLLKLTIDRFGASAPYKILEEKYGFTGPIVAEKVEKFLKA